MLAAIAASGTAFVKHKDQDNRFCISCHLHEELHQRTAAAPPTTLAGAHYAAQYRTERAAQDSARSNGRPARWTMHPARWTMRPARWTMHPERCFTCHSGEGVVGWTQVTLLSAWDAARWVAGDRHEPTRMRLPLTNEACLKCHASEVRGSKSEEETSKYHELANHRAVKMPCVSCHVTHAPGDRDRLFLDDATVRARCQTCHRNLGES